MKEETKQNLIRKLQDATSGNMIRCSLVLKGNGWDYEKAYSEIAKNFRKCPTCNNDMHKSQARIMGATKYHCKKHGWFTFYHGDDTQ